MRTKWYNGNGNLVSSGPQSIRRVPRTLNDRRAGQDRRGDDPGDDFPDIMALGRTMVKLGKSLLKRAARRS